ncbi:MAG: hypothetical protein M3Y33_09165 [Actinomycetota bacterium]|nr:hypothetical protein [Actinomycetota bacterium]
MNDRTTPCPPGPADHDDRESWGFVTSVLDAFEAAGYHAADDQHTGRAISYLGALARLYSGETDGLDMPGVQQPGGGWLSGPCSPAEPSPAAPADRMST